MQEHIKELNVTAAEQEIAGNPSMDPLEYLDTFDPNFSTPPASPGELGAFHPNRSATEGGISEPYKFGFEQEMPENKFADAQLATMDGKMNTGNHKAQNQEIDSKHDTDSDSDFSDTQTYAADENGDPIFTVRPSKQLALTARDDDSAIAA